MAFHGNKELPCFAVKLHGFGVFEGRYCDAQVHLVAWRELARLRLKVGLTQRPPAPSQNVTSFSPHCRVFVEALLILKPAERLWAVNEMVFCIFTAVSTFFQGL